jgi:hypothetical protein
MRGTPLRGPPDDAEEPALAAGLADLRDYLLPLAASVGQRPNVDDGDAEVMCRARGISR